MKLIMLGLIDPIWLIAMLYALNVFPASTVVAQVRL
jgi:hypothetical protein